MWNYGSGLEEVLGLCKGVPSHPLLLSLWVEHLEHSIMQVSASEEQTLR